MTSRRKEAMRRMRAWFDDHLTFAEVHVGAGAFCIIDLWPQERREVVEAMGESGSTWSLEYIGPRHYHLSWVGLDAIITEDTAPCE